jgi:hypothetical protein
LQLNTKFVLRWLACETPEQPTSRPNEKDAISGLGVSVSLADVAKYASIPLEIFTKMLLYFLDLPEQSLMDATAKLCHIGISFMPVRMESVPQHRCVAASERYYDDENRFDAVQIDMVDGSKIYARLKALFTYKSMHRTGNKALCLAIVQNFWIRPSDPLFSIDPRVVARVQTPAVNNFNTYRIVNINTIDHFVVLKRDFTDHQHDSFFVATIADVSDKALTEH